MNKNNTSKDFQNYKNKSKSFDSFNGTEINVFVKVPTGYDDYGRVSSFELARFGTVSSISAIENYSVTPIIAIGFSKPTNVATGSSMVSGNMVFETLNQGFVNDIKDILKKAGVGNIEVDIEMDSENNDKPKYHLSEITDINDFPKVDLVLIGVKQNDPNKKIEKQIVGVRFNTGASSIGITQISVREQYQFIAIRMEDFRPVIGADEENDETVQTADESLFFM